MVRGQGRHEIERTTQIGEVLFGQPLIAAPRSTGRQLAHRPGRRGARCRFVVLRLMVDLAWLAAFRGAFRGAFSAFFHVTVGALILSGLPHTQTARISVVVRPLIMVRVDRTGRRVGGQTALVQVDDRRADWFTVTHQNRFAAHDLLLRLGHCLRHQVQSENGDQKQQVQLQIAG